MMARGKGHILVGAGTNGAGKSTIVQPFLSKDGEYFNPDEHTRALVALGMPLTEANSRAWQTGFDALQQAIDEGRRYAFETTLGATSVPFELMRALAMGCQLDFFFVGLASPELHIQRVAERVRRGGHDIPETKIRERYENSRKNLLRFIGTAANLRVWDNSTQTSDGRPSPFEVFSIKDRRLRLGGKMALDRVPAWSKPLLARAIKMVESDFST
ncbi:MAG: zeta toxin family protein [Gallionella sp.]|jgi:predicted ABC-type ATPase|nr:zeta toxin family protein [Gallionella sp.]